MLPFLIAAGLTGLGAALKGAAAIQQGDEEQSIEQRNARLLNEAAADAMKRSQLAEMRAQAKGDAVIAEQRTATSDGGIDVNTGSSADIAVQTQQFTDLDKEIIRNEAMREAYGLRTKAQMHMQQGEWAARAGRNAALGALIGGIGQIAGIVGPRALDASGSSPTQALLDSAPPAPVD